MNPENMKMINIELIQKKLMFLKHVKMKIYTTKDNYDDSS